MPLYKWIDDIIIGLLDTYSTNDIYEFCDYLNIQIVKLDGNNPILRKNISLYYRYFYNKEVIYIRNDLEYEFERFILFHELGHAILHPNIYQSTTDINLLNKGKIEKQANYFAWKLLNITLDEIELYEMTLEQITSCLNLPHSILKSCLEN